MNLSVLSGGGRFGSGGAAGGPAKLPGGAAGQLWSFCGVGAAQESCPAHHELPVCAGSQQ